MSMLTCLARGPRQLWRIPPRGSHLMIAFCLTVTIFLLFSRSREHIEILPSNRPVPSSSNKTAFFTNPGWTFRKNDFGDLILETSQESKSIPYSPYPEYNSATWRSAWKGTYQQCVGAEGSVLDHRNAETAMKGHRWNQSDFPQPIFGSYEAWNLDPSLCTERESRYAVYGYSEEASASSSVQWDQVNWGNLQQDCLQRNADRFQPSTLKEKTWTLHIEQDREATEDQRNKTATDQHDTAPDFNRRTAVIVRTWIDRKYTEDDLHYIRSMITELSLLSGAEYEVILLVDAKDTELPPAGDMASLDSLKAALPQELRDLAVFFNSKSLRDWYPKIDAHETMVQYFQPVQVFSRLNPQYEYLWQFEMDSRYTGHFYHFLQQATNFAKQQPRRNLWERNSYFYIPAVHGSWETFVDQVDQSMKDQESIWGPQPADEIDVSDKAPEPPHKGSEEAWNWGIGEEADVITWLPQFDPRHTTWAWANSVFNFRQKNATPRRASVVSMSRLSSRLLRVMHADKSEKGLGLASEMSPVSWALFYGLKAVQIPQPIYHGYEMDPVALNRRANTGRPGRISAGWDSIWSWHWHNDILRRMSYAYRSEFAERIYRAWLGFDEREKESRPLCLPPMFLHPVKNTSK